MATLTLSGRKGGSAATVTCGGVQFHTANAALGPELDTIIRNAIRDAVNALSDGDFTGTVTVTVSASSS